MADITEEMKQAARDADCKELGHIFDITNLLNNMADPDTESTGHKMRLGASDPDMLPHLACKRCLRVWIIMTNAPVGYDAAETEFNNRVLAKYKRETRKDRVAKRRAEEKAIAEAEEKARHERDERLIAEAKAKYQTVIDAPEPPTDPSISTSPSEETAEASE